jgi:sigma-B regulation protein RsbU (phosphoserine phosphatase)
MTHQPTPLLADWRQRLSLIVETMREMSTHTDPQAMVRAYAEKVRLLQPADLRLGLSRRGLSAPHFRITRSSAWPKPINPWTEKDKLPLLAGGLLAELIYCDEPRILDDFTVSPTDPAAQYFAGHRSLLAIPLYDQGVALNMVVLFRREPGGFPHEQIPEAVWMGNLFGRATHNLVLAEELQRAYDDLDREMRGVGNIQRSLLPGQLPRIPTLDLAAFYQPSRSAGGDYYDFFPLPDGKWGILIADVSGHGTPAAVLMAITHCIAHTHPGPPTPPGQLLGYVNDQLCCRYTTDSETFVTAFYGIYDPARKELTYASAGHNPPRLKRCQDGTLAVLDRVAGLPLGIFPGQEYTSRVQELQVGDQILLYTDGITEAHNPAGEMFGTARLDNLLENCALQAQALLDSVLEAVEAFAAGHPADDDRTLIVARVV